MLKNLGKKDLSNTQQLEVAVNGPDGATHLIICTGVAELGHVRHETFAFLVGPQFSRRQFVGVTASGAISTLETLSNDAPCNVGGVALDAKIALMAAEFDDESGQVKVTTEVSSTTPATNLAISYNVNILAELPIR